tara:strand:+ start:2755 stop:3186 length:432 start_codon:yes stop_codon:yes gene_type:complete
MIIPKAQILGAGKLDFFLKELGREAIKDSELRAGLKKLAKPFISSARSNINNYTGNLSRSIGVIKGLRSKKGKPFVLIGPRYYKPYAGFHAHFVEAGKTEYDVEFDAQRNIERAYESNKYSTMDQLEKHILQALKKKLDKLNK